MSLAFAFDRATSTRTYDLDGRLHVARSNISRACVSPYRGLEIPQAAALGLDPQKIYRLLRDPDELAKAAPTFRGVPLMAEHVPVSSEELHPQLIVGAVGNDVAWEAPFLVASLVVWSGDAIRDIESGRRAELSCGYRYTPRMVAGVHRGEAFDGVMTAISGNHVALVEDGRAGADVVVGDRALPPPRIAVQRGRDVIRARYWGSFAY
jgi:hypothetical protein